MSPPVVVENWQVAVSCVYGVFTGFVGGLFDLGNHYLLVAAYSCVVGEFFELLEELVAVLEVYLSELFPSCAPNLLISVLPEPCPKVRFEILIGGVQLFPVGGLSYDSGLQFPPSLRVACKSRNAEDYFMRGVEEVAVE